MARAGIEPATQGFSVLCSSTRKMGLVTPAHRLSASFLHFTHHFLGISGGLKMGVFIDIFIRKNLLQIIGWNLCVNLRNRQAGMTQ